MLFYPLVTMLLERCQPPSTGTKYIFEDSFVRYQVKESEIGLENNCWWKVGVLVPNNCYKT